ncbi:MAG: nucleotidyltransferase family protein [Deltaproteobacteria bacterium]|nr:nucleotidyltransferase family protein [Deltaproteobacteria bacterium]
MSTSFAHLKLSPGLAKEEEFLVRLSRLDLHPGHGPALKKLAEADLNWARVLILAEREGLADLALFNLIRPGGRDLAPRIFLETLAQVRAEPRAMTRAQIQAGLEAILALQDAQLEVIALKGLALALLYYPEPLARPMSDTDLLVRESDLERADSVFTELGYKPVDASIREARLNPPGTLASVDMRRENAPHVSVHLHWHLVNSSVSARHMVDRVNLDGIWSETKKKQVEHNNNLISLTELAPHHFLLHLAEHCLRPGHGIDRLVLLADLDRILAGFGDDLDWSLTVREARAWGWEDSLYLTLSAAKALYLVDIPEEVLHELKPAHPGWGTRYFKKALLSNKRRRGLSVLFHFSLQKKAGHKIMFLLRILFPPASILIQRRGGSGEKPNITLYLRRYLEIISFLFNNINPLARRHRKARPQ